MVGVFYDLEAGIKKTVATQVAEKPTQPPAQPSARTKKGSIWPWALAGALLWSGYNALHPESHVGTTLVVTRDVDAPTRYDGGHVLWLKYKKGETVELARGTVGSDGQCMTTWHYESASAKLDAEAMFDCKDLKVQ